MESRPFTFRVKEDQWNLVVRGSGKAFLLLFHGYGQRCEAFKYWEEVLAERYTFVHVDLAFHGQNASGSFAHSFDAQYAQAWFQAILQCIGAQRVDVLAYSIGARVAQFVAKHSWKSIGTLALLAPDGLPVRPGYRFITQTLPGNWLFRAFVSLPQIALSGIFVAEKLRLISGKAASFYRFEIANQAKREQLFNTWMFYRSCKLSAEELIHLAQHIEGGMEVYLGQYDAVLPPKETLRYLQKQEIPCRTFSLELGHNLLSEKAVRKWVQTHTNEKSGLGAA